MIVRVGLQGGCVFTETSDFNPRLWRKSRSTGALACVWWDKDVQRHYERLNRAGFQPWLSRRRNEVRFRGAHSALWNKCQVSRRKVCLLAARLACGSEEDILIASFPSADALGYVIPRFRCSFFQASDWRRERDSNPRYPFRYSGFQDRLFQPLTHPSA